MAQLKQSKYKKAVNELIGQQKTYSLEQALDFILNKQAKRKFLEGLDVAVNLGVDPRKSDQAIRGSLVLPHGTGKKVRVAVFTSAVNADKAHAAGADIVGMEDLAEQVKAGKLDFDIVLATPEAMRVVGQLGQILGPRGLMPNPKDGTVTADIATAVKNAKMGQVRYRTDKAGVIHCTIGKINFSTEQLIENLLSVLAALKKAKPVSSKGIYIRKVTLSSTMGPGLCLDLSTLSL